jgi:hypothetical protein
MHHSTYRPPVLVIRPAPKSLGRYSHLMGIGTSKESVCSSFDIPTPTSSRIIPSSTLSRHLSPFGCYIGLPSHEKWARPQQPRPTLGAPTPTRNIVPSKIPFTHLSITGGHRFTSTIIKTQPAMVIPYPANTKLASVCGLVTSLERSDLPSRHSFPKYKDYSSTRRQDFFGLNGNSQALRVCDF